MTYDLLIRNVGVVRPNEHAVHKADIAIQGEKFARIEPNLDPEKGKRMGAFGRRRVLEWRYEAPKLIAAYQPLWPASVPRQRHAT